MTSNEMWRSHGLDAPQIAFLHDKRHASLPQIDVSTDKMPVTRTERRQMDDEIRTVLVSMGTHSSMIKSVRVVSDTTHHIIGFLIVSTDVHLFDGTDASVLSVVMSRPLTVEKFHVEFEENDFLPSDKMVEISVAIHRGFSVLLSEDR